MSEQIIRWEAPQPTNRGTGTGRRATRFADAADQLRAHRGEWAVLLESTHPGKGALAGHIRMGALQAFAPAGDFEAVTRRINGHTVVYARYLGGDDE